ncbi:MAG: amidase [Parvularculaceae bacterium]
MTARTSSNLRRGVSGLADAFSTGALTPVDALHVFQSRIERFNSSINAFLALRLDEARSEAQDAAERWRKGAPLSPIDGVPFGVKANIALRSMPWHAGIDAYRDRIAERDAESVSALRRAGAIPIGVLNMHEGALGATNDNRAFGRCRNPWNPSLTPGGSSGGSAAVVAAGLCAFTLGTDTMGSIRIPSAYCGIAGHKPSRGAVNREGIIDLSPTLDHVGPHALSAEDLQLVMAALAGTPAVAPPGALRVGVATWGGAAEVAAPVAAAFESAVAILRTMGAASVADLSGFDFGALRRRGLLISEVEGAAIHTDALAANPKGFSDEFRGMLEWGAAQPPERVAAAYKAIRAAGAVFQGLFDGVDVIIMPTAPQGPFSFNDPVPANQADFTALANFAGCPATAVPAAIDGAPPASIQFVGRPGSDALVLAAAADFERRRGPAPLSPLLTA